MQCPKCNGDVCVKDTRNIRASKIFRLRVCKSCKHQFFTKETIVTPKNLEYDEFLEDWYRYNRAQQIN